MDIMRAMREDNFLRIKKIAAEIIIEETYKLMIKYWDEDQVNVNNNYFLCINTVFFISFHHQMI